MTTSNEPVLSVRGLTVHSGAGAAVRDVSFEIPRGSRAGIVGESGCGKSMLALAIMRLLPYGWRSNGSVTLDGTDLLTLRDREMDARRGMALSMIFQDPTSSLNPTRQVGRQIADVIARHLGKDRRRAREEAEELLRKMRLPRPASLMRSYPHQLSGGQCQRLMIAIALACDPTLLVADEPTTALDVSVQKDVLELLNHEIQGRDCSLLLISHDLAVIASMCDMVCVMYAGRIVEQGPVAEVFSAPQHPYTAALLGAQPAPVSPGERARPDMLPTIPGYVPSLKDIPSGCAFRPRCSRATDICEQVPNLKGECHRAACWHPLAPQARGENRPITGGTDVG